MTTAAGFTEHLSEFFHEHGGGDIASRLLAVEGSTERIENMIQKLSQNLVDDITDGEEGAHASRGVDPEALGEEDDL